jgi:hypothetical protein
MRDGDTVALGRVAENRLTADTEKRKNVRSRWRRDDGRISRLTDELQGGERRQRSIEANPMLERARR